MAGGPNPGTGFDQLTSTGSVTVTGTTLGGQPLSFTPTGDEAFPIITSEAPIVCRLFCKARSDCASHQRAAAPIGRALGVSAWSNT